MNEWKAIQWAAAHNLADIYDTLGKHDEAESERVRADRLANEAMQPSR